MYIVSNMANPDWSEVRTKLSQHRQEHVLTFLESLSECEKADLYSDISELDLTRVDKCWKEAQHSLDSSLEKKDERLKPLDQSIVGSTARDAESVPKWRDIGLEHIAEGHVAVLLLAGGQGTRLGVGYPKGMYDVGLPSGKTLYQLQAERIVRLQELAFAQCGRSCVIPWYIMTSEHTRGPTLEFFEKHRYFGLDSTNVIVFEQNTLPCLEYNGKIILADKHRLARAPDGNGGLYTALASPGNGVLADLETRGVQCVHVYCVDNILVKMADPVFVGFCLEKGAECGAKVVQKIYPTERVGVVCSYDDRYQVVEYSEISIQTAEKRNKDGSLTFNAGNICNHFFKLDFLKRVCLDHEGDLVHHVAKKKVPYVDLTTGVKVQPEKPNGIKMEKFVFDVFQFARSFAVLEVLREDEFSPLKNAPGASKDTPATARSALLDRHYRHVLAAGGNVIDYDGRRLPFIPHRDSTTEREEGNGVVCEISPLVSYFGEGLGNLCAGRNFTSPFHLEAESVSNGNGKAPELKKPRLG